MHRRSFLKFLLSTPLAAIVDYEKLLWVPGEKTIFIPKPREVVIYSMVWEKYTPGEKLYGGMRGGGKTEYIRITLDQAIKSGHVQLYEVESITDFVNKVNSNA